MRAETEDYSEHSVRLRLSTHAHGESVGMAPKNGRAS